MVIPKVWYSLESKATRKCHLGILSNTQSAHTTHVYQTMYEQMKNLPKCMLYLLYALQHFLNVFVFHLNFIFSFILHPSYIIFYPCSYLLFIPFFPLIHLSICDKKGGEYTREYTRVYCHFYMTHVHILRGINFTSCTFVGRESHRGDVYTDRPKMY